MGSEETPSKSFDPDVIRTRSLLIWSQTRYRCATESDEGESSNLPVRSHSGPALAVELRISISVSSPHTSAVARPCYHQSRDNTDHRDIYTI